MKALVHDGYLVNIARGSIVDTQALARALRAGLLVSPGEFYGPAGSGFVRVAVVQPRERLELVAGRLAGTDITADTAAHPAPTP